MSEQIKDGGPAFPVSTSDPRIWHQDGYSTWQFPGLSVRDYFAAKAMQSIVERGFNTWDLVAERAYEMADAMLAARDKK